MSYKQDITRKLAESQELAAQKARTPDIARRHVLYTIYTENRANLPELVARYFDGATIYDGLGLWDGNTEQSAVIEVIGADSDLQSIAFLAADIKTVNKQQSVIVTWEYVSTLVI